MNENTRKLIESLAQKLGTTSELLWSVLLKQAKIQAITTLFQIGLIIVFGLILYHLHIKFLNEYRYEEHDSIGIIMTTALAFFAVLFFAAFFSIDSVINGFFNPEYWALDQVLRSIKD
jgi:amino acid transporter